MISQGFPFTCDLSEKHVPKVTFNRFMDCTGKILWDAHFGPIIYKAMIQQWNSPELLISAQILTPAPMATHH